MEKALINASIFEALFRQAVIDNFLEELEALKSGAAGDPPVFSERHEARMRKLFARDRMSGVLKTAAKAAKAAVIVLLAASAVIIFALMSVPAVRSAVTDVIAEWFEKATGFRSARAPAEDAGAGARRPSWLPEGFAEASATEADGAVTVRYSDAGGAAIIFRCYAGNAYFLEDNEEKDYYTISRDGTLFNVFESTDPSKTSSLIWERDGYLFIVASYLPVETLVRIAMSVN